MRIIHLIQVEFMETLVGLPAYYACIALEATGVTHFTWILAHLACRACGLEENNNQKKVKDIAREEIIEQGPVV